MNAGKRNSGVSPHIAKGRRAVRSLLRATKQITQYPPGHPVLDGLVEALRETLAAAIVSGQPLSIAAGKDQLFVDGILLEDMHADELQMSSELRRRGILGVKFADGVAVEELEAFVRALAEDPSGRADDQIRESFRSMERVAISIDWIDYGAVDVIAETRPFTEEQENLVERLWDPEMGIDAEDYERLLELLSDAATSAAILMESAGKVGQELEEGAQVSAGGGGELAPEEAEGPRGAPWRARGQELSLLDRQGHRIAFAFQRIQDMVLGRRPEDWQPVRRLLTDILLQFPPPLENAVYRSPRPDGQDVLREVAGLLAPRSLAIVLIPEAATLLTLPSDQLSRVVRRLAPDGATRLILDEQARLRLDELDIPRRLYNNAIKVLSQLETVEGEPGGVMAPRAVKFVDLMRQALAGEPPAEPASPVDEELFGELYQLESAFVLEAGVWVLVDLLAVVDSSAEYEELSRRLASAVREAAPSFDPRVLLLLEDALSAQSVGRSGDPLWRRDMAHRSLEALRNADLSVDLARVAQLGPHDRIRLVSIAGRTAAEAVVEFLWGGVRQEVREMAAKAIVSLGGAADGAIRRALAARGTDSAQQALDLLARAGDPDPGRFLEEDAGSRNWLIRLKVAQMLSRYPGPRACSLLLHLAGGPDETVRNAAIGGLGAMREDEAYQRLTSLARGEGSPSMTTRAHAVRALGHQGREESIHLLREILETRSLLWPAAMDDLRAAAAEALGNFSTPEARATLTSGMKDRRPPVAEACRKALHQIGQ